MGKIQKTCNFDNRLAEHFDLRISAEHKVESVLGGGYEHCGTRYHVLRKGFRYHVIEFIESGEGQLLLGGNKFPLHAGTLFSFGPGIPHEIQVRPENPLVKHYVVFTGRELIRQVDQMKLTSVPLQAQYPLRLDDLFKSLLKTGSAESAHRNEICLLQLKQIILYIDETAIPLKESRSPAWRTFLRVRQYIEDNFLELSSLDQLAEECYSDKAYLCRLFKRYANETPLQTIIRFKMRQAADLMLADPWMPIKKVAEEAGYFDPYYFSRVFKKVFGVSPGGYIEMFRGEDVH